jgi:hypothetical protein
MQKYLVFNLRNLRNLRIIDFEFNSFYPQITQIYADEYGSALWFNLV